MSRVTGIIVGSVIALFMVVYGSFAIYEGSWSLTKSVTQHQLQIQRQIANGQAQNAQQGWNYQTSLGQRIVTGIDAVNQDTTSIDLYKQQGNTQVAADEEGQRASDAKEVCYLASQVSGTLPNEDPNTTWIHANCLGGNLKPNSVYFIK